MRSAISRCEHVPLAGTSIISWLSGQSCCESRAARRSPLHALAAIVEVVADGMLESAEAQLERFVDVEAV